MTGGYDLHGNYYPNTQDAMNAETSQMNEIDSRAMKTQITDIQKQMTKYCLRDRSLNIYSLCADEYYAGFTDLPKDIKKKLSCYMLDQIYQKMVKRVIDQAVIIQKEK